MKPGQTESLSIHYDGWSDDITVEHGHLQHVATEYEFDNPVSGVPSGSREVTRTDADLTAEQLDALDRRVEESGFFALSDAYGAPEADRHYPYRLTITRGKQTKGVVYRSNPAYEGAPEAFRSIEGHLFDLSRELRSGASDDLYLMYDSPDDDIEVSHRHIRHVRTEYEFDSPVSSVPTRARTTVLVDTELTPTEHAELIGLVRRSGFESLHPAYGAPVDKRHYAYVLTIGFGGDRKVVTYRSNPSYEQAPEAFRDIESHLLRLSRAVTERVTT